MDIHFIPLRLTRHTDKQSILTAYSREMGRISLAVPASSGRAAARVRALVMPLSLVECVVTPRPGREVLAMSQVQPSETLPELHADPVKQMAAMFVAEVLLYILADGSADTGVYDFLVGSIRALDGAHGRGVANFPLCFLGQLTRVLGIEPDVSTYRPGATMDLRDGVWRESAPLHPDFLDAPEAAGARRLTQMTYANMGAYKYTRAQRARVLDDILNYYTLHYVSLRRLRSLEVLRSLATDVCHTGDADGLQ